MITKFNLSPCCLALISIGVLTISSELYAREFFNPAFLTDLNGSDVRDVYKRQMLDIATRQGFDVGKLVWVNQRYD